MGSRSRNAAQPSSTAGLSESCDEAISLMTCRRSHPLSGFQVTRNLSPISYPFAPHHRSSLLPVNDAFYDAGTRLIYRSITLDPSTPFARSPFAGLTVRDKRQAKDGRSDGTRNVEKAVMTNVRLLTLLTSGRKADARTRLI